MPKPGEHKTVQGRILQYSQEIGWIFVPRAEAETRRGFESGGGTPAERAARASLYFDDLLFEKVKEFNPRYAEAEGALAGQLRRLQANIFGNRECLGLLRNRGTFLYTEENRELDLMLIDYANIERNVFEVTEEFYINNGTYGMTGGQMAPTTLVGQKSTTTPEGRNPAETGYPMMMCEILSQLRAPRYIARFSLDCPANVIQAKKGLRKSFELQRAGKGFTFVELLSNCPTNWGLSPLECLDWMRENTMKVFPLGVFRDGEA